MIKAIKKGISLFLAACLLVTLTTIVGLIGITELHATGETIEAFQQEAEEDICIYTAMDKVNDILDGITGTLSRGAAVAVFYRVSNEPSINFEAIFTDVSGESDYADAIIWAYKNGIVHGFCDGSFKPYEAITTEQFALMLYRYVRILGYDGKVPVDFPQIPHSSDWAQDAMRWAVYYGWLAHHNPYSPLVLG